MTNHVDNIQRDQDVASARRRDNAKRLSRWTMPRWPQRYLPWTGPATRGDKILLSAFVAFILLTLGIRPLKPFLLASDPVLLEFLTGDPIAIGAGAAYARVGDAPLWLVVVAGAIGMVKLDWLTWWAGRRWGEGILRMFTSSERAERYTVKATELRPLIVRAAVLLAVLPGVPTAVVYAMAGLARMKLATFLLLNLVGALMVTGLIAGLGYRLGQRTVDIVLLIDKYATTVSLTLIAATVLLPVIKKRMRRLTKSARRRGAVPEPSPEHAMND